MGWAVTESVLDVKRPVVLLWLTWLSSRSKENFHRRTKLHHCEKLVKHIRVWELVSRRSSQSCVPVAAACFTHCDEQTVKAAPLRGIPKLERTGGRRPQRDEHVDTACLCCEVEQRAQTHRTVWLKTGWSDDRDVIHVCRFASAQKISRMSRTKRCFISSFFIILLLYWFTATVLIYQNNHFWLCIRTDGSSENVAQYKF